IDEIGFYDPNTNPATVKIDLEAAKKWIANGAQPTTVVKKLMKDAAKNA
ncbi:MAG: 30S ribosomal protein S16, partial [Eubacterium sp.]|nr:30S ribosomal protein S16 [Eubacterium sp.]